MKLLYPAGIICNLLILIGLIHSRAWKRTPFLFWVELASMVFVGIQYACPHDYWTWRYFYTVGVAEYFIIGSCLVTYPKTELAQWLPPCYLGIGSLQLYLVCVGFEGGRYSLYVILAWMGVGAAFLLSYCLWNGYIGPRGLRHV